MTLPFVDFILFSLMLLQTGDFFFFVEHKKRNLIPVVFGNTVQLMGTEDLKEAVCHSLMFHRELGDVKKLSNFFQE